MLDEWRRNEAVPPLRRAWEEGTLLTGLSTGALCWAGCGSGTAITVGGVDYEPVNGVKFIDGLQLLVHAIPDSRAAFGEYLVRCGESGIALENNTALEITDGQWRILTASPTVYAHQLTSENRGYTIDQLPQDGTFRPLPEFTNCTT
ncbi:Type 1 glutamine amidotransferase-like domain-containing protein [Halocatena halophila]|uniref:Type 1 glutamine amidotransferase-like domain-containing protein n=1 Tax=Halocatena halophila TaxID=2814576 RepID=UPI0038B36E26